jgi:hypothetical protein
MLRQQVPSCNRGRFTFTATITTTTTTITITIIIASIITTNTIITAAPATHSTQEENKGYNLCVSCAFACHKDLGPPPPPPPQHPPTPLTFNSLRIFATIFPTFSTHAMFSQATIFWTSAANAAGQA